MQETWVRFLGWEDPLEKREARYSWASMVAHLVKKSPYNVGDLGSIPWRREQLPTPAFTLLYFVLQSQTCLSSQISFDSLLLHFSYL